jgi:hypothetical protein
MRPTATGAITMGTKMHTRKKLFATIRRRKGMAISRLSQTWTNTASTVKMIVTRSALMNFASRTKFLYCESPTDNTGRYGLEMLMLKAAIRIA